MNKLLGYFRDSARELGHVKWPTRKQLVELTAIVLAVSLVMAAFTGGLDLFFQWGYTMLLQLAGK